MRRWILVTKNKDVLKRFENNQEINLKVDEKVRYGDNVLVYCPDDRYILYMFKVKKDAFKDKDHYKMILYDKKILKNPISISKNKSNSLIKKSSKSKFLHSVHLCEWSDLIASVKKKNPEVLETFEMKGCLGPDKDGFFEKNKPKLIQCIKKIISMDANPLNEEATKYRLVLPLMQNIGWNIYNLRQVQPEYRVGNKNDRLDYLLTDYRHDKTFLEVKNPDENLASHKCQIIKYCASQNVDLGILTNGLQWIFYNIDYHADQTGAISEVQSDSLDLLTKDPRKAAEKFIDVFWGGKICNKGKTTNRSLDDVINTMKNIKDDEIHFYNESAVKQTIVLPILSNLGWDIYNEREFQFKPHNSASDFEMGKGNKRIYIDAKALSEPLISDSLEKHEGHLLDYGDEARLDFGVLTNGDIWKFYNIKNRNRIKIQIINNSLKDIKYNFKKLMSKENVFSGKNIQYLDKKA